MPYIPLLSLRVFFLFLYRYRHEASALVAPPLLFLPILPPTLYLQLLLASIRRFPPRAKARRFLLPLLNEGTLLYAGLSI